MAQYLQALILLLSHSFDISQYAQAFLGEVLGAWKEIQDKSSNSLWHQNTVDAVISNIFDT